MNDGDVTIQSQSTKICDWRVEKKPEECHVHSGVTRRWVFVAKITGWKNSDSDNKVGHCQGKDEPVGWGMKATTFCDKKYYDAVSSCCTDWKCPAEWVKETFHVVLVYFVRTAYFSLLANSSLLCFSMRVLWALDASTDIQMYVIRTDWYHLIFINSFPCQLPLWQYD